MKTALQRFRDSYFFYSFKRDKTAMVSFAFLVLFILLSAAAPLVAPYNPYDAANVDIMNSEMPPAWYPEGSMDFLLGTDNQGRDLLSTMIYGLRISVLIGIGAVALQATLGILVGLTAGYMGGKTDSVLMRIADIQFSFPYLMVAIFISAVFQIMFGIGSYEKLAIPLLIVIIGLAEWPVYARTIRASVLG